MIGIEDRKELNLFLNDITENELNSKSIEYLFNNSKHLIVYEEELSNGSYKVSFLSDNISHDLGVHDNKVDMIKAIKSHTEYKSHNDSIKFACYSTDECTNCNNCMI